MATGSPEIRRLGTAFLHLQVFWAILSSHLGMTSEETRLTFHVGTGNENYIDLSSALTAANHKQYHQVSGKGVPYCYDVTIKYAKSNVATDERRIITAPNNWTTRNAVVKTSAAWKHQLKEAGVKMKDLSTYGRRLRIALDKDMSASGTGTMYDVIPPTGFAEEEGSGLVTNDLFADYTADDGTTVTYGGANEFTRLAIPDHTGAGDSVEMNLALIGNSEAVAANAYFGVVEEYLSSRGGMPSEPDSAKQTPDADSLLQTLFSSVQPSTDEVIEAVEDYMDYRPYNSKARDASKIYSNQGIVNPATPGNPVGSGNNKGVGSSLRMRVPLGLIKIDDSANKDQFEVVVHSIHEM